MTGTTRSDGGRPVDLAELRRRLRDLQQARADLPPHSAQDWRVELDDQIASVRRRIAHAEDDPAGE